MLSSPYLRATQTASILAKRLELGKDKIIVAEELSPAGHADRLIEEIKDKFSRIENIALVGHEPYLSRLASMLISGSPDLSITLKKGGVCRLSIEMLQYGRCASLDWLLAPAQLVEIRR